MPNVVANPNIYNFGSNNAVGLTPPALGFSPSQSSTAQKPPVTNVPFVSNSLFNPQARTNSQNNGQQNNSAFGNLFGSNNRTPADDAQTKMQQNNNANNSTTDDPNSKISVLRLALPKGTKVAYKSTSSDMWYQGAILKHNPDDGSYDLDIKSRAFCDRISPPPKLPEGTTATFIWPNGTVVQFYSETQKKWVFGTIFGHNSDDNTYNLDIRQKAPVDRMRIANSVGFARSVVQLGENEVAPTEWRLLNGKVVRADVSAQVLKRSPLETIKMLELRNTLETIRAVLN